MLPKEVFSHLQTPKRGAQDQQSALGWPGSFLTSNGPSVNSLGRASKPATTMSLISKCETFCYEFLLFSR